LTKEQTRDDEATYHEEDVDTDVAPLESGDRRVDQDDEHDGNRAKPLDIGAKRPATLDDPVRCRDDGSAFFE
jgi:hypothetical protein